MRNAGIVPLIAVILMIAIFFALRNHHRTQLSFHHRAQQSITGIGVQLAVFKDGPEIVHVLPGTPAARAGLHRGLLIQQVNGINIVGMPLEECAAMMRGPVGSEVQLEIVDKATHQTNIVEFTREKILLPVGHAPKGIKEMGTP